MSVKIHKNALMVILPVLGLVILFSNFKERNTYACQVCHSRMHVFQWRAGLWMEASIPLTPSWQEIDESHFFHDFFGTNHAHVWKFAQGSPYYLFGTSWGGCAIGGGRHSSQALQLYESSEEFRAFIQTNLAKHALDYTDTLKVLSDTSMNQTGTVHQASQELLDSFFGR